MKSGKLEILFFEMFPVVGTASLIKSPSAAAPLGPGGRAAASLATDMSTAAGMSAAGSCFHLPLPLPFLPPPFAATAASCFLRRLGIEGAPRQL
jgi:hypothetical protein